MRCSALILSEALESRNVVGHGLADQLRESVLAGSPFDQAIDGGESRLVNSDRNSFHIAVISCDPR